MITLTTDNQRPIRPERSARLSLAHPRLFNRPAWVVITQLFFGMGWIRAATEKLISPTWLDGTTITSFLAAHENSTLGWYHWVVDSVVSPHISVIALVVLLSQFGVGISLVFSRFVGLGLIVGMFLNLNFLAAGAVNPSVFYILSQGALLLWLAEQRSSARSTRLGLSLLAAGGAAIGLISLPYVSTLHPTNVVEDPAVLFVVGGILTVMGCGVALRRVAYPASLEPTQMTSAPPISSFLRS